MTETFDVCIVGSGPAGAFAANYIASKGYNVAIIEAGDSNLNSNPNLIFDEDSKNICGGIKFGFSQQIGGSSNLWAGGLAKFNSIDLEGREDFSTLDWPFNETELAKLYKSINPYFGINNDGLPIKVRPKSDLKDICNTSIDSREVYLLNSPFSTKVLVENVMNISLFERTSANFLEFSENSEFIDSIKVYNELTDEEFSIKAKIYILACGAITNIRLLLYSLEKLKSKVPDLYSNIGKYFSTHPKGEIGTVKLKQKLPREHILFSAFHNEIFSSRFQFGLSKGSLLENGLLNHCLRFDSPFNHRATKIFDSTKNLIGSLPVLRNGKGMSVETLANLGVCVYKFLDNIGTLKSSGNTLAVRGFFDQQALLSNKVTLSQKKSKSGLPLADISWRFSQADWDNVERFMSCFIKEFNKLNLGDFHYKKPCGIDFTGIHSHFMGGTRVGDSVKNSVVDQNLKVHKVKNLFISGPSVFPSFGYANPFYTIAALSLRLGKHIIKNL